MNNCHLSSYLDKVSHYYSHKYYLPNDGDFRSLFNVFNQEIGLSNRTCLENKLETSFSFESRKCFVKPEVVLAMALAVIFKEGRIKSKDQTLVLAFKEHSFFSKKLPQHPVICDLQTRIKIAQIPMSQKSFYEILAKRVGGLGMSIGSKVCYRDLDHVLHKYFVKKVIHCRALKAYLLEACSFDQSIVLFRPTSYSHYDGGLLTIADDFHEKIGKIGYELSKSSFKHLFKHRKKPVHVVGFSLAGVYAARLLADFPSKISHAYFYNDPSTETSVNRRFIDFVKSHPSHPIKIEINHQESDFITWFGQEHIGYKQKEDFDSCQHLSVKYTLISQAREHTFLGSLIQKIKKVIPFLKETYRIHTNIVSAPHDLMKFFNDDLSHEKKYAHQKLDNYEKKPTRFEWYENMRARAKLSRKIACVLIKMIHRFGLIIKKIKKQLSSFYDLTFRAQKIA